MEFLRENIYLDKSWRFTFQVLILIVLGILVIVGLSFFVWRQQREAFLPENTPLPIISLPEGYIPQKTLDKFSAPSGGTGAATLPPETLNNFSAKESSKGNQQVPEDVLNNYSAPK